MISTSKIKPIIVGIIIVFVVSIVVFFGGSIMPDSNVSTSTQLCYGGNSVLYNSVDGDIYIQNVNNNEIKRLIKNKRLISSFEYILCSNDTSIDIYDYNGILYKRISDLYISYGEVHNNVLYYINSSDSQNPSSIIMKDLNTGQSKEIESIRTTKFTISNECIYYENNKNSIYKFNLLTGENIEIYSGRYCFYFCVDDGDLYLSDYSKNNSIIVVYKDGTNKHFDINSIQFCIANDLLYYIEYIPQDNNYNDNIKEYTVYKHIKL